MYWFTFLEIFLILEKLFCSSSADLIRRGKCVPSIFLLWQHLLCIRLKTKEHPNLGRCIVILTFSVLFLIYLKQSLGSFVWQPLFIIHLDGSWSAVSQYCGSKALVSFCFLPYIVTAVHMRTKKLLAIISSCHILIPFPASLLILWSQPLLDNT